MRADDNLVTPIIVTHYSPKDDYGSLKPPTTGIVEKTIQSMSTKLEGIDSISSTPIIIYNYPQNPKKSGPMKYESNLELLADEAGFDFYSIPNDGLRNGILTALGHTETKYILFLEHDWKFLKDINIKEIIYEMESNRGINYIKFNKRENIEKNWDTIVVEEEDSSLPLCKTSGYSNNPHIARTTVYKGWIERSAPSPRYLWTRLTREGLSAHNIAHTLRVVKDKYLLRKPHVSQYDGVEFVLDSDYKSMIKRKGFERAHSEMGLYLYGNKGEGPFVEHLGGDY